MGTLITKAQRKAVKRLWDRSSNHERGNSYLAFRRRFKRYAMAYPCMLVSKWAGMFIGIEPDGHIHS